MAEGLAPMPKTQKMRAVDMEETLNITRQLKSGVEQLTMKQNAAANKIRNDKLCRNMLQQDLAVTYAALEEYKKGYHILRTALKRAKADIDRSNELKEAQRARTKHVLGRMVMEGESNLLSMCIQAWYKEVEGEKKSAFFRDGQKLRADRLHGMEEKRRRDAKQFLERMVSGNNSALVNLTFSTWATSVVDERELEEATKRLQASEEKLRKFQAKQKAEAHSVLERMSAASSVGILNMAFEDWAQFVATQKKERAARGIAQSMEDHLKGLLAKKQSEAIATLMRSMLEGTQASMHKAFSDWAAHVQEEKKERELLAQNAEQMQKFVDSKREQAMRTVARLAGDQTSLLVESCLENWARQTKDEKKEKEFLRSAQAQVQRLQDMHREKALRVVERMCGGKAAIVVEAVFESWAGHYRDEKKDRDQLAGQQEERFKFQQRKREKALQFVTRLAGTNDRILMESSIMGWSRVVEVERRLRKEAERKQKADAETLELQSQLMHKEDEITDLTEELAEAKKKSKTLRREFAEMQKMLEEMSSLADFEMMN